MIAVDVPKALALAEGFAPTPEDVAMLYEAGKVTREVITALQHMVHWYGRRAQGSDTLLPIAAQPDEVREAMRALTRAGVEP